MGRYINPFTDWGFKKIFGQEANKDIVIFFLNELLKGERCITDITFLDKESLGRSQDDRTVIYDVYCQTDTGERIIVEMQNKNQVRFVDRSVYYVSKAIVEQAGKGRGWDYRISAVYGIFFMNFESKETFGEKFRTDVALLDRDTGCQVTDKIRLIYLQLPYFTKEETDCDDLFECFIYVLKKMEVLDRMPFEKKNFIFSKLEKIAEVRKLTEQEQWDYDQSLKHYWDANNVLNTAISEGLERGRTEGRAEGRAEEKLSIAKLLLSKKKMPIEEIMELTGLSKEEILN